MKRYILKVYNYLHLRKRSVYFWNNVTLSISYVYIYAYILFIWVEILENKVSMFHSWHLWRCRKLLGSTNSLNLKLLRKIGYRTWKKHMNLKGRVVRLLIDFPNRRCTFRKSPFLYMFLFGKNGPPALRSLKNPSFFPRLNPQCNRMRKMPSRHMMLCHMQSLATHAWPDIWSSHTNHHCSRYSPPNWINNRSSWTQAFWADMVNIKQQKQLFETTTMTYQASISSWWLNQPIWKICSSNWIISPIKGEHLTTIWNHHLDAFGSNT